MTYESECDIGKASFEFQPKDIQGPKKHKRFTIDYLL